TSKRGGVDLGQRPLSGNSTCLSETRSCFLVHNRTPDRRMVQAEKVPDLVCDRGLKIKSAVGAIGGESEKGIQNNVSLDDVARRIGEDPGSGGGRFGLARKQFQVVGSRSRREEANAIAPYALRTYILLVRLNNLYPDIGSSSPCLDGRQHGSESIALDVRRCQ